MAPVAIDPEVRYTPLILVVSHFATVVYLTCTIGLGLYRSYKELSPSQGSRLRISRRAKIAPVFAGLALLGLGVGSYYSLAYMTLSYKVWVDERGLAVPNSLSASTAKIINGTSNEGTWYINKWLTSTPIYTEAVEIVTEKARRFWWGNQLDLATTSWSMLLAIEGRRKNIPFLWAYPFLALLVNLSFAQNLFYVALLLTPAPLDGDSPRLNTRLSRLFDRVFPTKPNNWCPSPVLFLGILIFNYGTQAFLPYAAGTPSFSTALSVSKLLTLAPVLLPAIIPESWGTVHEHPHDAYGAYTSLYRFMSVASLALHTKSSVAGFMHNLPGSHKHRHSIRIPFDTVERSNWERTTTSAGKVLGSLSDHPVVARVGYDVILSAVSLGLWAALRALDVEGILLSAIPFYKGSPTVSAAGALLSTKGADTSDGAAESTGTKRRRGHKAKAASDANDEIAATATGSKRKGRPRKSKAEEEPEDNTRGHDSTYTPTPTAAESAEGDLVREDDWESASLAWGLTALGGLGVGSAGVFGAECISR